MGGKKRNGWKMFRFSTPHKYTSHVYIIFERRRKIEEKYISVEGKTRGPSIKPMKSRSECLSLRV